METETDTTVVGQDPEDLFGPPVEAPPPGPMAVHQAALLREINSWGKSSIWLGVIHLLMSSALSASWGVILIIVGGASFYFREAAMLIVYGVTLVWVAITNIIGAQGWWIAFGLLQLYFAFITFRQFFRFRRVQQEHGGLPEETPPEFLRAARSFPWIACVLGVASLGGFLAIIVGIFVAAAIGESTDALLNPFGFLMSLFVNLGVVGLAVGLGSLLSRYRYKGAALLGAIASGLTVVIQVAIILL